MPEPQRLLIRNATVLSQDAGIGELDRGDVLVEGDRIGAVGADLDAPAGAEVLDATGCVVVPGFVDTHRHMFQALLRGCAPQHTLGDYFTNVLGEIAPRLGPDDLHVGNLLGARAALGSGVTTVQDISNIQSSPAHTDALVAALRESGLRAVFAYGKSYPDMGAEGAALPADVARVRADLLPDPAALVTMALVTEMGEDDAERHNAKLARELDVRTARHVAAGNGVTRLRDLGVLRPGTTFIHGNGLGPEDLRAIADGGGSLSVAPAIELMMGHGYPETTAAMAVPGLPISLSLDVEVTCAADMFTQMRAAFQAGRNAEHAARRSGDEPATHITVRDVLRWATLSGAQTLGLGDRTGSLTPGKQADLVVLRADRPDVAPVHDPVSTVVLQMDRSHVDTVLVAGVPAVRAGRAVADSAALLDRAAAVARGLAAAGVIRA